MEDLEAIALTAYGRDPGYMNAQITAEIGIKRCGACREWLRVENFTVDRSHSDGLMSKCRDCVKLYYQGWAKEARNSGKTAEYSRKYRQRDPERERERRLRERCNRYNITVETYRELLAAQNHGCAICGRTEEQNGRNFAIDHDHRCCDDGDRSCGKCVRGLLCSACNIAVGYFEQEDTRKACEAYVQHHLGDEKG